MDNWSRRATRAALAAILVLGAGLRIWGMAYGLPQPHARPDEDKILGPALAIARDGDPHPRQFTYPSLPTYLHTGLVLAERALGRLRLDGSIGEYVQALYPARALAVAMGVATIAATFALALQAYGRPAVALGAALVAATNLLHVLYSRFVTVDAVTSLFVTLSLLHSVRAAQGQGRRHYVLAGVFAGLAASSKFNVGIVGLALLPAAALGVKAVSGDDRRRRALMLVLAAVAAALAFALTSPYCVLRIEAVIRELRATSGILYAGSGERALFVHLRETLPSGFGWPVFLACGVGVVRALWLRRPADLALLAFLLPMFALVASVKTVFPRYLVPFVPPLAVLAAEVVLGAPPVSRVLRAAAALALVLPSLLGALRLDRILARPDTRVLAAEWLEAHVPRRVGVVTCKGYGTPTLDRPRVTETYCGMKRVAEGFPGHRYLVTQEHPAFTLTGVRPDVLAFLARRATPVAEQGPFRADGTERAYFFGADAFFVPFSGFGAVERGGPVIKVWDLEAIRGRRPSG
jgi:hypothetical protein